jgi:hypothetical protein
LEIAETFINFGDDFVRAATFWYLRRGFSE